MSQSRENRRSSGKNKKEFQRKQRLEAQAKQRKKAKRKERVGKWFVGIKKWLEKVFLFLKEHITFSFEKKNFIQFGIFFLIAIGLFIYQMATWDYVDQSSGKNRSVSQPAKRIYSNISLKQTFSFDDSSVLLEGLGFLIATYGEAVESDGIMFRLYNSKDEEVYSQKIPGEEVEDNRFYQITFPEKIPCGKHSYYYTLTGIDTPVSNIKREVLDSGEEQNTSQETNSEAEVKKPPTVWLCKNEGPSQKLYINEKESSLKINTVYYYEQKEDTIFLMLIIQLILIFGLSFVRFKIKTGKVWVGVYTGLVLISNAILVEWIVQNMGKAGIAMKVPLLILTYAFILALTIIISGISGNILVSIILVDSLLVVFSLANYFVMMYRGYPIVPTDLLSVGTLNAVVSNYEISISPLQLNMVLWFIIFVTLCLKMRKGELLGSLKGCRFKKVGIIVSLVSIIIGVSGVIIISNRSVLSKAGIVVSHWRRDANYYANGPVLNFLAHFEYTFIKKPNGYSDKLAKEILEEYSEEESSAKKSQPNIIMVMNESLTDYSLWDGGEVTLEQDPLPFLHSMEENTIKGKCYSSVVGGGTANSELEALTGHSMAFFPVGSVVYQLFPQEYTKGLASDLKAQDYSCIAMHPQNAKNWNRNIVYPSMEFDQFLSESSFKGAETLRYPTDKATYEKIIELYEKKEEGQKLFLFDVTMQGHGGYTTGTKFDTKIKVKGKKFPQAEEYLSSTYVSDQAFQYLIEYFEKQDEPTVICMFGDHQPGLSDGFYDLISSGDSSLEETQKRYVTPYVIWANYDIQEYSKDVSINQLSGMVKDVAGVPLSNYERFIRDFSQEVPVINALGFKGKDGNWYTFTEETPYDEWLKKYNIVQYYLYCRAEAE